MLSTQPRFEEHGQFAKCFFQANGDCLGNESTDMKTSKMLTAIGVSAALALSVAQAKEKKHDEGSVKSSDVPAAVQKAAETEAKGGKIVRWEKEGGNYEAVIEKNGKQTGFTFDAKGKKLNKHDEAKEKGEKH